MCFMRQSDRIEKYKSNPCPANSLHAYYNWKTGSEIDLLDIPSYARKQHLQLDAVALYINYLSQMIKSGLQLIFTTPEVAFVQNLGKIFNKSTLGQFFLDESHIKKIVLYWYI